MQMSAHSDLLDTLLEPWDRNNIVMLNLLNVLQEGGLEAKATESSPTVPQHFSHSHHERLVSVSEEAPEYAKPVSEQEWATDLDKERIAVMLNESAKVVKDVVKGQIQAGKDTDLNYGHPILLLQMLLWHEGYHLGQMKLALKISGVAVPNEQAGPLTWDVWRQKIA